MKLADSHSGVFMGVHLHEGKSAVRLEPSLNNKTEILEQRNEIILRGVGSEISDVAGCLPLRGLLNDHIIALNTMCREVMMTEGGSRGHSHSGHGLLLGN